MSALRILLVEDETRLADAVKQGLGEEGFTVETAESAEAAEPIIARGALDLIVLDLQLPGKNGIDLLRELRAGGNQTPVLILTARGSLDRSSHRPRRSSSTHAATLRVTLSEAALCARTRHRIEHVRAWERLDHSVTAHTEHVRPRRAFRRRRVRVQLCGRH